MAPRVHQRKCSVDGCGDRHSAKGFCNVHYKRVKRYGRLCRRQLIPPAEIFKSNLRKTDTGCIEWTGTTNGGGYGVIYNGTKMVSAHRYAWELASGPIPDGMCILHRCDNPPCCNIEHLFIGTHTDNVADKFSKGRDNIAKGSKNGLSKLTESDIPTVRERLASCEAQGSIAGDYGVSRTAISAVATGRTWKHVK